MKHLIENLETIIGDKRESIEEENIDELFEKNIDEFTEEDIEDESDDGESVEEGTEMPWESIIAGMDDEIDKLADRIKEFKQWRKKLDKVKRGQKTGRGYAIVDSKTSKNSPIVKQLQGRTLTIGQSSVALYKYLENLTGNQVSSSDVAKQI